MDALLKEAEEAEEKQIKEKKAMKNCADQKVSVNKKAVEEAKAKKLADKKAAVDKKVEEEARQVTMSKKVSVVVPGLSELGGIQISDKVVYQLVLEVAHNCTKALGS